MANIYTEWKTLENAILDDLRNKVTKEIGSKGAREARSVANEIVVSDWNSYVQGLNKEKFTKLEGHPVSGEEIVAEAGLTKYGTGLSGSRKGGATRFTYLLYNVKALDDITSAGNPAENLPYWYIIEYGSGSQNTGEGETRTYTTRGGDTTSLSKSYAGKWQWVPWGGKGDRNKGFILSKKRVDALQLRHSEPMEDYPAGNIFTHAAQGFIDRFRSYMETGS